MKKCYDCTHVEMCGWRKEVKEQGCEFFDDGMVWIPCSERLPEPYRHVLVSLDSRYDGDATYDWITETFDGKLKWYDWDGHVIAWMPLPERYRGGDGK